MSEKTTAKLFPTVTLVICLLLTKLSRCSLNNTGWVNETQRKNIYNKKIHLNNLDIIIKIAV